MNGITERIDAITKIPPAYRHEEIPAPRAVKIELTAACDFKCWFCANAKDLRVKGHMEWELYRCLARELRDAGVEELGMFYLGESFLYPRLAWAIIYAKTVGFPYVFLTTNGNLASPARVKDCIEAGLDSLKFSFNWGSAEDCKEITHVDAFARVVQNIKDAQAMRDRIFNETGHRCGLYASSIMFDGEKQKQMEAAIAEIRPYVDEHYWLPLYNQAGHIDEQGRSYTQGNRGRVEALRDPLPCWAAFTEGHITFDGKLSACCFDHNGQFEMGDLTSTPFLEAWNGEAFHALRRAHLNSDVTGTACETCVAYQ